MNLNGISMNFAGVHQEQAQRVSATADNYYGSDAMMAVQNGDVLHVIRDGEKVKLSLLLNVNFSGENLNNSRNKVGTLGSVSLEVMKKAVEVGVLQVEGKEYKITNSRALRRLLA